MADDQWQAWIEVVPDFSQFKNKSVPGINNALGGAGVTGGQAFGGTFTKTFAAVLSSSAVVAVAGAAGRLIGETIGQGINYALDAVDLASSLAEQQNAVKVAFGESANDILELASGSLDKLFLSELSFDKIAVQFSNFAKSIAGEGGDVAKVIDDLTTRGADFASVYDLDVSEALALFQSGLAGETEPLRQYGIDLSAASVNAYAYANGIAEAGKQLTETQRVQAAYGLLLQSTNNVTGDLANTSGSYANQQRRLNEALLEAQTALGTALLPTFTTFITLANDELLPVLNEVIAQIGPELGQSLADSAPAIAELIREAAPLIPQLVKLGSEALPIIVAALRILVPLLTDGAANTTALYTAVNDVIGLITGDTTIEELTADFENLGGSLADGARQFRSFVNDASANLGTFSAAASTAVSSVVNYFAGLPGQVLTSLGSLGTTLYTAGQELINGFIEGVKAKATALANAALKTVKDAVKGVKDFLGIKSPSTLFREIGTNVSLGFIGGIEGMAGRVEQSMLSLVPVPAVSASSGPSMPQEAAGFINYGTIQVTDEAALVDEVEKRKRRAYARSGLDGLKVA